PPHTPQSPYTTLFRSNHSIDGVFTQPGPIPGGLPDGAGADRLKAPGAAVSGRQVSSLAQGQEPDASRDGASDGCIQMTPVQKFTDRKSTRLNYRHESI